MVWSSGLDVGAGFAPALEKFKVYGLEFVV